MMELFARSRRSQLDTARRALDAAATARTRRQRARAKRLVAEARQELRGPAGVQDRPVGATADNWSDARVRHVTGLLRDAASRLEDA